MKNWRDLIGFVVLVLVIGSIALFQAGQAQMAAVLALTGALAAVIAGLRR